MRLKTKAPQDAREADGAPLHSWVMLIAPRRAGVLLPLGRFGSLAILLLLVAMSTLPGCANLVTPSYTPPQPPTQPILRIEAGMHTAAISSVSTDAAGRFAVTASLDKTARVWDLAAGRLLTVLRPPLADGPEGVLLAAAMSPTGQFVAVGGFSLLGSTKRPSFTVYLFESASGQLVQRLIDLPNIALDLAFSSDGHWLAAVLGSGEVVVWHLGGTGLISGPAVADRSCEVMSRGLSWSVDGRLATTCDDGKVRLYRPQFGNSGLPLQATAQAPGGKKPAQIAFSPDGRLLAVGYQDIPRVDVIDGANLAMRYTPSSAGVKDGDLSSVAWSADGQSLLAGGSWQVDGHYPVRRWPQAGLGEPVDTPAEARDVTSMASLPDGRVLVATADPTWGFLSPSNGRADGWRPVGLPPIAKLAGSLAEYGYALSHDGREVQFGYESKGQAPYRFEVMRRTLQSGKDAALHLPLLDPDAKAFEQDVKALVPIADEGYCCAARSLDAASFVTGSGFILRYFKINGELVWEKMAPEHISGVNIPPLGRVVVAAYNDGTIRWYRLSDGQELLAFFPHADRKRWVLWTPSGYYDASPGAEDLIGWHVNRGLNLEADFFPASSFRSTYYRPDVIDRVLDTQDEELALAQADEAANRKTAVPAPVVEVLPPVVNVLSSRQLRAASTTVEVKVKGRAPSDAQVTNWRVRVNGQAVAETRGAKRVDGALTLKEDADGELTLSVPIPAQDSVIEVFAENRHGVSTPAMVHVSWTGPTNAAFQIQPKLYVLAVGVAQYQHPDIPKLLLSAKDARDFANVFLAQKGKLYRDVEVKILTDAKATRDAVVDGLDWLQRQVTQHDVGVVFIAGHGQNDPTMGYTFLPFNADPDRLRSTGVPMSEFTTTLSKFKSKALFFFDTCHSGNVLGAGSRGGANDVNGVINELSSADNGVVVFSSSTGRQLSYEDAAWGNGAFTKAVVEGLGGKADFQKNGRITHKMLDLYVSERVKELTKGRQSPVTQSPGGVPDFPLALIK